jgi:glycosyltransferase involved in cell wall biosynthesis
MSSEPLVSCIMPTMAGREVFRQQALECYESQTWSHKDLVVVDSPGTVGAKRNIAVAMSRGEILCHWDDDDWSAPGRIEDQVRRLLGSKVEITGYHSMIFENEEGKRWKYNGQPHYALGTSLCYWKSYWRRRPFRQINTGEDNAFIQGTQVLSVDAGDLMVARIHGGNTSPKNVYKSTTQWMPLN